MSEFKFVEGIDYYLEKGQVILTEEYLAKRIKCCGSGYRHELRKKDGKDLVDSN